MATLITGSICLTDLVEMAKKGHSAFSRSAKNQKVYVNFTQWLNDEPDKYGNHAAFTLNSTKEKKDEELAANEGKKIYFGHAKIQEKKDGSGEAVTPTDASKMTATLDDLPF